MTLVLAERIHPTAVISPEAEIGPGVQIGPYAIIEGEVRIGPGCIIEAHACLNGPLEMGEENFIGHGAVLGKPPQSRSYNGEPTGLVIGSHNVLREYVTIHRGTVEGGGVTRVGDHNLLMIGTHLGHDVSLGSRCTLVNNTMVAGHVELSDGCVLSGHSVVQQHVRIGRLAMLGGLAGTTKDIPPFVLQQGYNCVTGLNVVGLRRAGVASDAIAALRVAFRVLYKEGRTQASALERIEGDFGDCAEIRELTGFIRASKLGINPARSSDRQQWNIA